jgi:hypothetical protein
VADALSFPWGSIITFGIDKATKFHTDMRLYASDFVWVMNKGWYDKLAAGQKKVIDDHCNNEWAGKVGAAWGDEEDSGQGKLEKTGGPHHRQAHACPAGRRGRRPPSRCTPPGPPAPTRSASTASRRWRTCAKSWPRARTDLQKPALMKRILSATETVAAFFLLAIALADRRQRDPSRPVQPVHPGLV